MKILALNATYRPEKTTTQLIRAALAGAASLGAETEMILLYQCRIAYCLNCLKCYQDLVSEIAPCSLKDDMDAILEKIKEADGIIFGSPVHNGFVSGLMTVFFERLSWRVARPGGSFLGIMMGIRSRLTGKTRALAAISSAGGMSAKMRKHCDDGTPWLRSNAPLMLHGAWIGDMYAGAVLKKMPRTEEDWNILYFLRGLSSEQLKEAETLGIKIAKALQEGNLQPVTLDKMVGPFSKGLIKLTGMFSRPYQTLD
jgi:multimeric flavodoxin WrbA